MGRSETAAASLGFKILLPTLVKQMNRKNKNLIVNILQNGFIEDENEYLNDNLADMMYNYDYEGNGCIATKNYLLEYIKQQALSDEFILFPVKEILSSTRWGYERLGYNGKSRLLNFVDMTIDMSEYKEIKSTEPVFIIHQYSS